MSDIKHDPLIEQIKQLVLRARREGEQDGIRKTMEQINAAVKSANPEEGEEEASRTSRVPLGTARALIARALSTSNEPLTAAEIAQHARTAEERRLALPTLYNELSKGRNDGRYQRTDNRRWTLA